MNDPYGREWANKRWDLARGIEHAEYNNLLVLVRATVADTAKALSGRSKSWIPDAVGKRVTITRDCSLVYRITGHKWTIVYPHWLTREEFRNASTLSLTLNAPVIEYAVSDTAGGIGYQLFEGGKEIESFSAPDIDGANAAGIVFSSASRPQDAIQDKDPWTVASEFFRAQDALEPGIFFQSFFASDSDDVGTATEIVAPKLVLHSGGREWVSQPPIERIDFLTF